MFGHKLTNENEETTRWPHSQKTPYGKRIAESRKRFVCLPLLCIINYICASAGLPFSIKNKEIYCRTGLRYLC